MAESQARPRFAMVSIGIRRDLLAPLENFRRVELVHLYRHSVYGDLTAQDFSPALEQYNSPLDLYRKLVNLKPALIQTVEPFSYYTLPLLWASVFAARRVRAPFVVVTYENRPLRVKFGSARAAFLCLLLRPILKRACLLVPQNQGAQANLDACGAPRERTVQTLWGTWGVDPAEFMPRTEPAGGAPVILFVGRLAVEKGVWVLLEAFARVAQAFPTANLLYVGDGPEKDKLESDIRTRGLQHRVKLTGTTKHRDLPPVFRAADIFCAPSLTTRKWAEQVGASAMQAMASGLPVVSTPSGAIPEYVLDGEVGLLVPEQDPAALADAILRLLHEPDVAQALGQRGRALACARYDAAANVRRAEQLMLEHCLARGV